MTMSNEGTQKTMWCRALTSNSVKKSEPTRSMGNFQGVPIRPDKEGNMPLLVSTPKSWGTKR